jgi:hypothetical protein
MSADLVLRVRQEMQGGSLVRLATLRHPQLPEDRKTVRIDLLTDPELPEPPVLDGFVLAVLMFAMRGADRLVVEGPVSARLLRNLRLFQEAWRCWLPRSYRVIPIVPDCIVPDEELPRRPEAAIAAFSGGVDATFTALRHAAGRLGPAAYPLRDALLVWGFDIDRRNVGDLQAAARRATPLLDDLGVRLHVVRTNLKTLWLQDWLQSFGVQLAAMLHQFSGRFGYALVASAEPYNNMVNAIGSTPATDYLLSGGLMDIVHDGAGFSRTQKVARIAQDPIAVRGLRVCWQGADQSRNCGLCEKCTRTHLNFLAVGHPNPECFDAPLDLERVRTIEIGSPATLMELETILEHAASRAQEEWYRILAARVAELRPRFPGAAA